MASKSIYDYRLVDDETGLKEAISQLRAKLERNTLLAVDCEGVSLSRKGALTIVTVATEEKAYVFDVLKLGKAVFSGGLGEILEDKSHEMLMFDCREDADALWHQFNVKLSGVLDLQLLEIMYRRENAAANPSHFASSYARSWRPHDIESIYGFGRCLELYVQDRNLMKAKDTGSRLLKHDSGIWRKRPLSERLIEYCSVDTVGMFRLFEKMKYVYAREQDRLRVASERYADMIRGKTERYYDEYEKNAYLPLGIIPDRGNLDFVPGSASCTGCHRLFPRGDFSNFRGEQKCKVCQEIKRRRDERSRRQNQWRSFDMDFGW